MIIPTISDTSLFLFAICIGATIDGFVGIFIFPRYLINILRKNDRAHSHYREIIRGSVSAFITMEEVRFANKEDSLMSLKEMCRSLNDSANEMLPIIDIYLELTALETGSEKVNWAWSVNGFFFRFSENILALECLPVDLNERYEEAEKRLDRIAKDFSCLIIENPDTLKYVRN
jgi:hypothetical protein